MNIGKTIKKLRKQKDMTQEQLAEYLNISPQAISRWEIGSTLPDITLIPMLANIFDVPTDILLGVDIAQNDERIQKIIDNANQYAYKGHHGKASKILRSGLNEFPNSFKIMSSLMSCVWKYNEENKEEDENLKETVKLGGVSHNITANDSMYQLEQMNNSIFDSIRNNAEFIEITEELKKYAKSR